MDKLPAHLKRYIVSQDYARYTSVDQSVWRYILRQLRAFLAEHAHPCYLDGLSKTGISVDHIPRIEDISRHLEVFGWRAVPVSGFIPPAAFMELQAYGFLPIAADMRTLGHLMYTPAPDIVHEAAGHAPILIDPAFATYLRQYAQVARKAIISKQDMDQYDAIRSLSDIKEHPDSTPEQIRHAEDQLDKISKTVTYISEAARLGRMNWWTAEYGLIGPLSNPKIYGAGLLSSVGEARNCLNSKVRKIPLTLECVDYAYDITEPQPQLFVTPDFQTLSAVLEQLADTMAFRTGGVSGVEKAVIAQTVNTVEFDSGLQIGGQVANWIRASQTSSRGEPGIAYLQFQGPTQLALDGQEIAGHGRNYHAQGFGTPLGFLRGFEAKSLFQMSDIDLARIGVSSGKQAQLTFSSGVVVDGTVCGWLRSPQGNLLLITFSQCTVTFGEQTLFRPEWGLFDMGVGDKVVSVYGGPPDREAYGPLDDFVARRVPAKAYSNETLQRFAIFQQMRDLRDSIRDSRYDNVAGQLTALVNQIERDYPQEWLLKLEAIEIGRQIDEPLSWMGRLRGELETTAQAEPSLEICIRDGLSLVLQ